MPRAEFSYFADGYPGLLHEAGNFRLCVSCDGSRYVLLVRYPAPFGWRVERWSKSRDRLGDAICNVFGVDAYNALPPFASDVPRPWSNARGRGS